MSKKNAVTKKDKKKRGNDSIVRKKDITIYKYKTMLGRDGRRVPTLVSEKEITYRPKDYRFCNPESVVLLMTRVFELDSQTEEYLYCLCFDNKNSLLGVFEISHGDMTSSRADPKSIFTKSLLIGAASIALVHNHPSGDPTPSKCDILLCKRIFRLGFLLGIRLNDFIIIGDDEHCSFLHEEKMPESMTKEQIDRFLGE